MHKNLLARPSEFLRTTSTNAFDGKLDLKSWDGETVGHFVDFLYLHAYDVRRPEPLCPTTDSPEGTVSDTTETESRSDTPDTIQADDSRDSTFPRPLTPIHALIESFDAEDNDPASSLTVEPGDAILDTLAIDEYHWFLFAHAKVYALAQSLGIVGLQRMAYRSLAGILTSFEPVVEDSVLATSSIELMRYVYSKTHSAEDPMRNLVTQFGALNFPALQRMDGMKEVIRDGGELAVDLVEKVCRRLVVTEDELSVSLGSNAALAVVMEQQRTVC